MTTNEMITELTQTVSKLQKDVELLKNDKNYLYDKLEKAYDDRISLRAENQKLKKTSNDIEEVIALIARIPPKTVNKNDKESLKNLERDLKNFVFGQDKAIEELASSIKLSRAGLRDEGKPIGSYLFSGPTGVGKTEVARQLSKTLGIKLLRFYMSEYMERHTVSRLIELRRKTELFIKNKI